MSALPRGNPGVLGRRPVRTRLGPTAGDYIGDLGLALLGAGVTSEVPVGQRLVQGLQGVANNYRQQMEAAAALEAKERAFQLQLAEYMRKAGAPQSDAGKLEADYRSGMVGEDAYRAGLAKLRGRGATTKWALDRQTNRPVAVTDDMLLENPDRYTKVPTGTRVDLADGTSVSIGDAWGDPAGGPTKKTINDLQGTLVDATARFSRMSNISRQFDEAYHRLPVQLQNALIEGLDRAGLSASVFSEEALDAYDRAQDYYSDLFNHLNQTLKEMSGAAVTEHEFRRLQRVLPTENDGPRRARRKLQRGLMNELRVIARTKLFLRRGRPATAEEMAREMPLGASTTPELDRALEREYADYQRTYGDAAAAQMAKDFGLDVVGYLRDAGAQQDEAPPSPPSSGAVQRGPETVDKLRSQIYDFERSRR